MYQIDIIKEEKEIARKYKAMLQNSYQMLSEEDKILIRKAFDLAREAHKDQRRKSGEPYIYHPLEVGKIAADEIGLDAISIASALLHDVVEDTSYTIEDIERLFGSKIAKIIDGLTKIQFLNNQGNISSQSENYRKLLLTLSEDIRVILIKIADRLHNMRTLESMLPEKQMKIASETIYIYAPLAHRMGLYSIKSELEDLSLKYTYPEEYESIEKNLEATAKDRERYLKEFTKVISSKLKEEGLNFEIKGRTKAISSIYRKMKRQNVSFEEVYDIFAIRIIYKSDQKNEKFLAWKVYSIVTDQFRPNPNRMRDWITTPRSTGYESLHITVVGPESRWIEVQIRSSRMDEIAEKGIAAHYKYKEGYVSEQSQIDQWISRIRDVIDNQTNNDTRQLLDDFKLNLYSKEIFVFTPQGDLKVLANGATALDFAYEIHSKIGNHCLGAKINGRLVPLSHKLKSGDQVEIITSANQSPKQDWLDFVVTSKARSRIKSALNAEKRKYTEEGKEILIRKLKQLKITFNENELNNIQRYFGAKTSYDIFYQIAIGIIDSKQIKVYADSKNVLSNIISKIRRSTGFTTKTKEIRQETTQEKYDLLVFGPNEEKLEYQLASCCNPIPGDKVFGFLSIGKGIKVHKESCPNAINMHANYDYRIIKAKWVNNEEHSFAAEVTVQGFDRLGVLNEITQVISNNMHIDIKNTNFSTNDGIFEGKFTLGIKNKYQLNEIIKGISVLKGITSVKRI